MKKKVNSIIYIVIFILLQIHVIAQKLTGCDAPYGQIDPEEAKARVHFFETIKKDIIQKLHFDVDTLTINVTALTQVLEKFTPTGSNKIYDGVRVYFAIIPNSDPTAKPYLSIILVPTIATGRVGDFGKEISNDDESNVWAYIIPEGKFEPLDIAKFIKWTNRYQSKIIPKIQSHIADKYHIEFTETYSLWFSKEVLFSPGDYGSDLLTYLNCAPVAHINIDFASWVLDPTDENLSFKNDLIFEIVYTKKDIGLPGFFTLGVQEILQHLQKEKSKINKKDSDKALKEVIKSFMDTNYTDTGLPCPPYKCP